MADAYSWRTHAVELGLHPMHAWIAVQREWPTNDRSRKPGSPKKLDALCEDPDLVDFIRGVIEDRARSHA